MPATQTAATADLTARKTALRAERIRLSGLLQAANADHKALNRTRGPLGHGVVFHADRDAKAAALLTRMAELRADLERLA